MSWLTTLGSIFQAKNPIDSIFEGIDRLSTSKEEKELLRLDAIKLQLEEQKLKLSDKDSARAMYAKDSSLQKIFAIMFLLAYMGLTGWLMYLVMTGKIRDISTYEANLLGIIWGAMSSKVNTITDFLFGGSQSEKDSKIMDMKKAP
jgi:hypothetical protein